MKKLGRPSRIETRSIDFVPDEERHGKISHQGPFWFLSNFHFMSIALGFVGPSMGLSVIGTIIASILGILIGTTFQAFHATQGPVLGLPQMIQSRAQFGFRGVIVPLLAALFSPLSFNIVATVLIAASAVNLWHVDRTTAIIAVAVVSGALAIYGHDWMHRAFRILFWLSMPLYTIISIAMMEYHGAAAGHPGTWIWPAFFTQLATTASYNLGFAPYVSDYSRYLPRTTGRTAIIAQVFLGSAVSAIWLISLGAWLAAAFGRSDGLMALHQAGNMAIHGLGELTVIVSICSLVAVVGMNSYSGMLMVITTADCLSRVRPTRNLRIGVLIGWTIAWAGFANFLDGNAINYVGDAMVLSLYALIPWTAVNLVDFFIVRRGEYSISDLFTPQGIYGAWNGRGLVAYASGFVASIPFFVVPGIFTGPVAAYLGGVDISWLVGLLVSGVVYLVPGRAVRTDPQQLTEQHRSIDQGARSLAFEVSKEVHMPMINAKPYNWPHSSDLDARTTALIIIDMQRDFCENGGYFSSMGYDVGPARNLVPHIVALRQVVRDWGGFVIYTREGHRADLSDLPPQKRFRSRLGGGEIGSQGPLGRLLVRGEPGLGHHPRA